MVDPIHLLLLMEETLDQHMEDKTSLIVSTTMLDRIHNWINHRTTEVIQDYVKVDLQIMRATPLSSIRSLRRIQASLRILRRSTCNDSKVYQQGTRVEELLLEEKERDQTTLAMTVIICIRAETWETMVITEHSK